MLFLFKKILKERILNELLLQKDILISQSLLIKLKLESCSRGMMGKSYGSLEAEISFYTKSIEDREFILIIIVTMVVSIVEQHMV